MNVFARFVSRLRGRFSFRFWAVALVAASLMVVAPQPIVTAKVAIVEPAPLAKPYTPVPFPKPTQRSDDDPWYCRFLPCALKCDSDCTPCDDGGSAGGGCSGANLMKVFDAMRESAGGGESGAR